MQTNIPVVDTQTKHRLDKLQLVKIHLYIYLTSKERIWDYSDRELEVLAQIYCVHPITDKESMQSFFQFCYAKEYAKFGAENSIRNILSKAKIDGILKRKKVNHWKFQRDVLNDYDSDVLVFQYLLTNYEKKL